MYPPAAIHEFPEDIFTKEQRKKGAVFLHALCVSILKSIKCNVQVNSLMLKTVHVVPPRSLQAIYMFYALAIVCNDYFVPSLEKISEVKKQHQPSLCLHSTESCFILEFFLSFRTCSSVKMWPERRSWLQEALLLSFLPHSLVSTSESVALVSFYHRSAESFSLCSAKIRQ